MNSENELSVEFKLALYAVIALVGIIFMFMMFGVNSAGQRTVIQYPTGGISVKFEPGVFFQFFGKTEEYNDVISYNFDKTGETEAITVPGIPDVNNPDAKVDPVTFHEDKGGISVRYQDGGRGKIFGIARFNLPNDESTMIALHKAFRSMDGVTTKLIEPIAEESLNLTAGLLTSEEAYAEKRGSFIEYSRDQLQNGKYKTVIKQITETEEVPVIDTSSNDDTPVQKNRVEQRKVTKDIPVIAYDSDGMTPLRLGSDLKLYGITISGYQVTDWDFEPKTLLQIAAKRSAVMAIITSKAEADRAKQDAVTAEQTGLANVMRARYTEEVEKTKAIVNAEKQKEIQVIAAKQNVEVAEQGKLEAIQKKLEAEEYRQEQEKRGQGDAAYKKAVIQADGALEQKLKAWITVNEMYAEALGKQKQVPDISLGGTGANGGATQNLIELLTAQKAKQIALDLDMSQK